MYYHVGLPQDYIELTHLPAYLPPSMIQRLRLLSRWVYYVSRLRFGGILSPVDDNLLTCSSMYIYPLSRKVAVHCALNVCSPDEHCIVLVRTYLLCRGHLSVR